MLIKKSLVGIAHICNAMRIPLIWKVSDISPGRAVLMINTHCGIFQDGMNYYSIVFPRAAFFYYEQNQLVPTFVNVFFLSHC